MNIFVTSASPEVSARNLDKKRMVKMVLESAQLLSTALHFHKILGTCRKPAYAEAITPPYKVTHLNHPVAVWTRQNKSNYVWLLDHFRALLLEYEQCYGKTHKCQQHYATFSIGRELLPDGELTPFVNCTTLKDESKVITAYCKYLRTKWAADKRAPQWRQKPKWA